MRPRIPDAEQHSSASGGPTPAERGWQPIDNKIGPEWGASYRGHFLDLAPAEDGWHWSITHPRLCAGYRGRSGLAPDVAEAERLMIVTVDGFGCAARRAAA